MKFISLYNSAGQKYPGKYYKKTEYEKALKSISHRRLFEKRTKRKIFFLDDKFPKRMIDKKSFEITTNKDEADLIFIPDVSFYIKCSDFAIIKDEQYCATISRAQDSCGFVVQFYKHHEKYLDILDDKRVYAYDELYKICRKNNPPLLDDEISQIKEMLTSTDRDVKEIAAMMVVKSNIPLDSDMVKDSYRILYLKFYDTSKLTKELRAFLNEW